MNTALPDGSGRQRDIIIMRHFTLALSALVVASLGVQPGMAAEKTRKPPYFASIAAGRARMRTGPARNYPASWLYQRADLPVKVTAVFKEWRKVTDPDGTEGWMLATLMSSQRTAIVRGPEPVEMREAPVATSRLMWRAAPGVVGRLSRCADGWCRMDVKGQAGFVEIGALWGVEANETLP